MDSGQPETRRLTLMCLHQVDHPMVIKPLGTHKSAVHHSKAREGVDDSGFHWGRAPDSSIERLERH